MPNHSVTELWMGQPVQTLEDLLRPGLFAVCVGINPAPASVAAGHYYQGRAGQRFFSRLRDAGLIDPETHDDEDDTAFAAGIGFTDIIKRPTARASQLLPAEYEHGRAQLLAKLETYSPQLVLFTFKRTAQVLFGRFAGNGFVPGLAIASSQIFVMPGPYESHVMVSQTMQTLKQRFGSP